MGYFGLTGGIASGKSTAARLFAELGARIIDADRLGHEVIRAPSDAYREIRQEFGDGILGPSGEIDRVRLGRTVFADAGKLRRLNAIVHPRIIGLTEKLATQYRRQDAHAVILVDAALIFEAGIGGHFRKVIVVWCRPELQLERLMAKARITRDEATQRIALQMPVQEKRRRADYLIDSSGSLANTRAQVGSVYRELKGLLVDDV
jgi:dephospho-CoA kinase